MRDGTEVKQAFLVDPLYLKHHHENDSMDLRVSSEVPYTVCLRMLRYRTEITYGTWS